MIEIVHRFVNGNEVSLHDLSHYQITDRTVLEIVNDTINRSKTDNCGSLDTFSHAS